MRAHSTAGGVLRMALVLVCLLASSARSEPWYRGKYGKNRFVHLSVTLVGGVLYPANIKLEEHLAPETCRSCMPTSLDRSVRDALVWDAKATASTVSDITAFALAPAVSLGLVALYTPPTWADVIDDMVPILETMLVTELVTSAIKLGVGRERPYAHFSGPADAEDNLSFLSGHSSRVFALAASAATVARMRGYPSEPYLWVAGMLIGATTAYLRIAGDRHYLTDVVCGGALGLAAGLSVPRLMERELEVLPARNGVAIAGAW